MCQSVTDLKQCRACGTQLELQAKSYTMGSHLFANRFQVDIYACPKCKRIELFAAERDMVTCPVCGTVHPTQEKCAICALNTVLDGKYGR